MEPLKSRTRKTNKQKLVTTVDTHGATAKHTLYVLDTNVLMHDPSSLFRFEENDIYLPMITLEELDGHKRGTTEVARNARQVARDLDVLSAKISETQASHGVSLSRTGHPEAKGKLFFQTGLSGVKLPTGLPDGKADNVILGVVEALRKREPGRNIVLVSKDINMRVKARALGLPAQDYHNDKVLEDSDLLPTGSLQLPANFWLTTEVTWDQKNNVCTFASPLYSQMHINQFVYYEEDGKQAVYGVVTGLNNGIVTLGRLTNYDKKERVFGIAARNREQNFALNLLMNPECDFITLTGMAGTGKTLMTLAAGLAQVVESKTYSEIIITRVTVPIGEDIGFLPGSEEEKMNPWMGALDDNLEVLNANDQAQGEWGRAASADLIRSKIKVKSLNFMRGRTFLNKFVIIDEAQNLTPKQMKTLITRAGPGTKIVCLGNLAQIDTPYLTEGSSGLTYAIERFKGWPHGGHILMRRGQRSRLADFAEEVL